MSFYADNQPNYYTTMGPPLVEVKFDIEMKSEVRHTDDRDICDPTSQNFLVRVLAVRSCKGPIDLSERCSIICRALSPTPCHCEHDCCGHRHGYATGEWLADDLLCVNVRTSRNY